MHWGVFFVILLRISQNYIRLWFNTLRQQAITSSNVDTFLRYHIALSGHNESAHWCLSKLGRPWQTAGWKAFNWTNVLTRWFKTHFNSLRPKQMDAISQTTFSSICFLMKMFGFRLKFHWSLFLRTQLTIIQHWFRWWLGADKATSHYLIQWWVGYRRIYASLGLNVLMVQISKIIEKIPVITVEKWKLIPVESL